MTRQQQAVTTTRKKDRYNKLFKMVTPHVNDSEIKVLIKRYPPAKISHDEQNNTSSDNDIEALEV